MKKPTVFYVLICFSLGFGLFAGSKLGYGDNNRVRTVIQSGLRSHVENICFNSDASIFASYDEEGIIKLWDLPKGRLIKTLSIAPKHGELVAFDDNGCLIFRDEDLLYLIDPYKEKIKSKRKPVYLKSNKNGRLSRNGKVALTISKKNNTVENVDNKSSCTVRVWSVHDDKLINKFTIAGHPDELSCTISSTGNYAAFESITNGATHIEIYDLKKGTLFKRGTISVPCKSKDNYISSDCFCNGAALSRDGNLYVRCDSLGVTVYDTSNFKMTQQLKSDEAIVGTKNIYFGGNDKFLFIQEYPHLWTECRQVDGWKKVELNGYGLILPRVFISPDLRYFIFASSKSGGFLQHYDDYALHIKDNRKKTTLTIDASSWIHRLALSSNGQYMAITEEPERSIKYYSLINGKLLWEITDWDRRDSLDLIGSMSINGNGRYLSVRTNDGKVFIWDVFQKSLVLKQSVDRSSVSRGIALSNSGDYLAIGSSKETVIVKRSDGSIFKKIPISKDKPYFNIVSLQFSADDRFIAIGISNYVEWYWSHLSELNIKRESQIEIWDLKKQKIVTTLKGFADDHYPFGFNSTCDVFLAGDKVFSLPDGKLLYTFDSIQDLIKKGQSDFWTGSHIALAFSIGMNNIAKAWHKKDGIEIIDSKNGNIKVTIFSFSDSNIAVSPEGFFSGDGDFNKRVNFVKNNRLYEKKPVFNKFYRPDLVERKLNPE